MGVSDAIDAFGSKCPDVISLERVRSRIGGGSVLCVSMDGRTNVIDALARVGFGDDALKCFTEEKIPGSRNSNLMDYLRSRAAGFGYLLYAWDGLRTSTPEVKAKFQRCYEAATAAKVAEMFKRWVLSEGE